MISDVCALHGSGAFFGLKVQNAKNRKQLLQAAGEAESLRKLKGCGSIVQIVDHAVLEDSLRLVGVYCPDRGPCGLGGEFASGRGVGALSSYRSWTTRSWRIACVW